MKKVISNILRFLLLWVLLVVSMMICTAVFEPGMMSAASGASASTNPLAGALLMYFLNAAVIVWAVHVSTLRGWRLAVAIFLLYFGVHVFLTQIESVVFLQYFVDIIPADKMPGMLLSGTFTTAVFSLLVVLIWGRMKQTSSAGSFDPAMPAGQWILKFLVLGIIYLIVYLAFGVLVAKPLGGEEFNRYYHGLKLPAWFPLFQIVRGMIWTAVAIPVLFWSKGRKWQLILLVACLFTVLMGASLIPSNPFMPDKIRLAHLAEVSSSNFLFGLIAGAVMLLGRKPRPEKRA